MPQKVDVVDENENKEEVADEEVEEVKEVKMVPKRIQCPRCKGTGTWVSSRTGVRAQTAGDEVAVDASKPCPRCRGRKSITIHITEEQAQKEAGERKQAKAKIEHEKKRAKAKIDEEARAKKREVDQV